VEQARLLIKPKREEPRRPAAAVLGALRLLGRELRGIQWRYLSRSREAVLRSLQNTERLPPMIGRYIMGNSSLFTGDLVEARAHTTGQSRSMLEGIARWRCVFIKTCGGVVLSVMGLVAPWLP
jgi:hypothetical protein